MIGAEHDGLDSKVWVATLSPKDRDAALAERVVPIVKDSAHGFDIVRRVELLRNDFGAEAPRLISHLAQKAKWERLGATTDYVLAELGKLRRIRTGYRRPKRRIVPLESYD